MYKILLFIISALILLSCKNSTEPNSDSLKLVLSADKMGGTAPLTVNFTGRIEGNTEGLVGQVPDYFFFSRIGMTVIPYSIPDTSQALIPNWSSEKTYPAGEYKVVLLYQGIKDGENLNLYSDTLFIQVN